MFDCEFGPLFVFQVQDKHFVVKDACFVLPSIDDHASFEDCCAVILARRRLVARRLADLHHPCIRIELQKLTGALAHFSFWVKCEAAAENVYFATVGDRTVALPPVNCVWT